MPNLTVLFLDHNRLNQIPNLNMPDLTGLFLQYNQLDQLPDLNLPNLIEFNLANNRFHKIPNLNLPSLIEFSLAHNHLTEIPNFTFLKELTKLNLQNNLLSQIPSLSNLCKLSALCLDGNALISIPDVVLQRFSTNDFLQRFKSQMSYHCQSPLASLYQRILINNSTPKEIQAVFESLEQTDKKLIFEMVNEIASSVTTDDLQSSEYQVFNQMPRFGLAVQKTILIKLERLSKTQKDQVYGKVCHLAAKPLTDDPQWGENHAKEHLPRLADALSLIQG